MVALAGLAIVLFADHRDRDNVDRTLAVRATQVRTEATRSGSLPTDGTYVVRLVQGTDVRAEVGSTAKFSIPVKDGYSTVTAENGSHWRSWAETLKTGVQMQILIDLQDVENRHSGNVRMIDLIVILAAIVAAAGTWIVGGLVLRPLLKLAQDGPPVAPEEAAEPSMGEPSVGAPSVGAPSVGAPSVGAPSVGESSVGESSVGESSVGALVSSPAPEPSSKRESRPEPDESDIEMRATELASEAAEQFAREAAGRLRSPLAELGEGLDQLLDNPDMSATQRHLYLASIQTGYRRIVTLVDDLEARAESR